MKKGRLDNRMQGSIIVPTRNEGKIIEENLRKLMRFMESQKVLSSYEVIISDHSEDATPSIVLGLKRSFPQIRLVKTTRKGIGAGIRAGVNASRFDCVMYYQADLAFDPKAITDTFTYLAGHRNSVVVVSRKADGAQVSRPLSRRIASKAYNVMTRKICGFELSDTQGTLAFRKSEVSPFWHEVVSDLGVMQTEVLFLSHHHKLKLVEIPGVNNDKRNATFARVIGISFGMLIDMGRFSLRRLVKRASGKKAANHPYL